MGFRDSYVTSGLETVIADDILNDLTYQNVVESLSPQVQSLLKTLEENQANTQLEEGFTSVTGILASQAISRGILGGAEETSIIAGGVVGSGEVQTLVGANSEFRNIGDFVPGVLFGVGAGGDNSTLFIGPSMRYSIFTIAAGARFFDFDGGTRIREGGVISVDLSRVTGGKPSRTTIDNSSIGGGWDKVDLAVANDISEDTAILYVEVDTSNLTQEEIKKLAKNEITLFQKTDSEGKQV